MGNKLFIVLLVGIVFFGLSIFFVGKGTKDTQETKQQTSPAVITPSESSDKGVPQAKGDITLNANGFEPQSLTVKAGTRITWLNKSGAKASVNSDPHPVHNLYTFLNLGTFGNNQSLQTVFEKAGTYTYHNHFNPTQTGTIVVQ